MLQLPGAREPLWRAQSEPRQEERFQTCMGEMARARQLPRPCGMGGALAHRGPAPFGKLRASQDLAPLLLNGARTRMWSQLTGLTSCSRVQQPRAESTVGVRIIPSILQNRSFAKIIPCRLRQASGSKPYESPTAWHQAFRSGARLREQTCTCNRLVARLHSTHVALF